MSTGTSMKLVNTSGITSLFIKTVKFHPQRFLDLRPAEVIFG